MGVLGLSLVVTNVFLCDWKDDSVSLMEGDPLLKVTNRVSLLVNITI